MLKLGSEYYFLKAVCGGVVTVFMKDMLVFDTKSREETELLGEKLAKAMSGGGFVAFYGDLGAGKTAFIRGMGKVLCPGVAVCSPTYAIINEYSAGGRTVMCHVDAYRIKDDDDLCSTGFYDVCDYPDCVIAVEWSENIPFALPEKCVKVRIEKIGDSERRITINDSPTGFLGE